jgi:hypothetical protein
VPLLPSPDVDDAVRWRRQFQIHQSRSYFLEPACRAGPHQLPAGHTTKYIVYRYQIHRRPLDSGGCAGALEAAFTGRAPAVNVFFR